MSISEPEKLKMETADMTAANIERIAGLFPNVITEIEDRNGSVRKGIDFDLLRQELSGDYVEGREERYDFTWVGKRQAIIEANWPIQKTLRPCIEESKDWENTENVYIEGDNLDALKLLQESYLNKVKMIYIDPPYNTGKDFVYKDRFVMDSNEYDEETGAVDEEGNYRFKNPNRKDEARYHSKWCSMLYPRLKLARNLLRDDGVIFVSIDDNEVHNLRKIMNEIFGEDNFVAELPTIMNLKGNQDQFGFAGTHEYILVFSKNKDLAKFGLLNILDEDITEWDIDEWGYYKQGANLKGTGINAPREKRKNLYFPLYVCNDNTVSTVRRSDDDIEIFPITDGKEMSWRWEQRKFEREPHNIIVKKTGDNNYAIYKKQRPDLNDLPSKKPKTLFYRPEYSSGNGTNQLRNIFNVDRILDNPKPLDLLRDIIEISTDIDSLILDFFAGSCTTAHAALELNKEDGGRRTFIMVQLPETCDENTEAYKSGFKNISEIGKERIRRAGEQIKKEIEEGNKQAKLGEEPKSVPDIGFRVFKIDDTNMKDVYYSAAEYSQETIEGLIDNVKEDRTDLDLLYQVLINWGLPLDLKHEMEEIDGYTIHTVDTDALIACFEPNIPESVMRKIAEKKPLRAVFRDGSFRDSPSKLNIEGIFKTIAPDTKIRVI
jgi:adenine-specific DNA-methyltransferase